MSKVEKLLDVKAELAEGPVWDADNSEILWVDILKGEINRVDLMGKKSDTLKLDQPVGAIALTEKGRVVAATPIGLVDALTGVEVSTFSNPDPKVRMNDGKADPCGRFVGGTMSVGEIERDAGSLWSFSESDPKVLIQNVTISNGLDWSEDGATMFYVDTPTQKIDAFDYDLSTGEILNQRDHIHIDPLLGAPDGMCIDSEGGLWVALWGGSAVIRIFDGKIEEKVDIPARQVTCVTFAGGDLDYLIVTSASDGLKDRSENDGDIFIFQPGVTGKEPNRLGNWAE
tara:strand:- start:227 stop:1081 length:855 start_codon:yes stop_codon:yes gene_type:complete